MKWTLPLTALVVILASGCSDSESGSLNTRPLPSHANQEGGLSDTGEPVLGTAGGSGDVHPARGPESTAGGMSSVVFPPQTPPTDQESVTPRYYWQPKEPNTVPPHGEPATGETQHG